MHPLLNKLAPSAFVLKNQHNIDINLADIIGRGQRSLVLFFYPKNDTFGCTKEACSFRDQFEELSRLDADVIGVSSDSVESHKLFAEQHKLPYTLLSDLDGKLREAYQVPKWFFGMPG
ncbi:Peroxiredoxin bcp1 [Apophysomyces ossiformis]|uniref:thioredoxin-dependent peroxiredoxin n=1 Tax=Apophysomyces ossiformis TaxID=679940 RepID=A0A8H7BG26_9FUNG|nr:Peroxiredoxin bcp1 [Apophysomyces ossiformis]